MSSESSNVENVPTQGTSTTLESTQTAASSQPSDELEKPASSQKPSISDLLASRLASARSRGRGRGSSSSGYNSPRSRGGSGTNLVGMAGEGMPIRRGNPGKIGSDAVVQSTDKDAANSRLSAVKGGYMDDEFARLLVPDVAGEGPPERIVGTRPRPFGGERFDGLQMGDTPSPAPQQPNSGQRLPITNRGTYVRIRAIDTLLHKFLQTPGKKQIVSLGAGSDTRYFRLVSANPSLELVYHEIDFEENTKAKTSIIRTNGRLRSVLEAHAAASTAEGTVAYLAAEIHSPVYNLHAADLRKLTAEPLPNVERQLPTLILSECCLCYLTVPGADGVLKTILNEWLPEAPAGLVIYEPVRPDDPFGRMMVQNLEHGRGIRFGTLAQYSSLESQRRRLGRYGLGDAVGRSDGGAACDVHFLWERWTDEQEKERISGLEMVDEIEEWELLAQHYCVTWGCRGSTFGWDSLEIQLGDR